MRKADLISEISEKTGVPKVDVLVTIEALMKTVKNNLNNGESVSLRGFGTFMLKDKAPKTGRNIKAGETVFIPGHRKPYFKPAREWVHEVREKTIVPDSATGSPVAH